MHTRLCSMLYLSFQERAIYLDHLSILLLELFLVSSLHQVWVASLELHCGSLLLVFILTWNTKHGFLFCTFCFKNITCLKANKFFCTIYFAIVRSLSYPLKTCLIIVSRPISLIFDFHISVHCSAIETSS